MASQLFNNPIPKKNSQHSQTKEIHKLSRAMNQEQYTHFFSEQDTMNQQQYTHFQNKCRNIHQETYLKKKQIGV